MVFIPANSVFISIFIERGRPRRYFSRCGHPFCFFQIFRSKANAVQPGLTLNNLNPEALKKLTLNNRISHSISRTYRLIYCFTFHLFQAARDAICATINFRVVCGSMPSSKQLFCSIASGLVATFHSLNIIWNIVQFLTAA